MHGAGGGVDGRRSAHQLSRKTLPLKLGLAHHDLLPDLDQLRIGLRNIDVHTQRVGLRQREQQARTVDQIPHIYIAPRDHPGEGRHNTLEVLQLAQASDIGFGCRQIGLRLRDRAAPLVQILL